MKKYYEIEIKINAPFKNGLNSGYEEITYIWQTYAADHIYLICFYDQIKMINIDEERDTCQIELSKEPENNTRLSLELEKEVHFQYINEMRSGWVSLVLHKTDRKTNYELKNKSLLIEEYVNDSQNPAVNFQKTYKFPIIVNRSLKLENLGRNIIIYRISDDGSVLISLTKRKGFGVLYKIMPNGGGYHKYFKSKDVKDQTISRNVWLDFKIVDTVEKKEEAE